MDCTRENIDHERVERSCGFLKRRERQYLLNQLPEDEFKNPEATKRNLKAQIPIRTKHAIADFRLMEENLPEEEKREIIKNRKRGSKTAPEDNDTSENIIFGNLKFLADIAAGERVSDDIYSLIPEFQEMDDMLDGADSIGRIDELDGQVKAEILDSLVKVFSNRMANLGYDKEELRQKVSMYHPE